MKLLGDMGVSVATIRALRETGEDVTHLRDEGLGRLPDEDILAKARREGRVVVTFDLDFGDLLASGLDSLPSVIIFRLRDQTPSSVTQKLREVVRDAAEQLLAGAIIVVEDARYRIRRLPIQPSGPQVP
jgi:predicted nuclease of predicted toxin-antitoxin system